MINAAELIHIYLVHGYVLLASKVACEYIEAVQGNGKEYFGLKAALHTTSPPVWLPFNLFDQLLLELKDHSDEPIYQKVLYLYLYKLHTLEIRSEIVEYLLLILMAPLSRALLSNISPLFSIIPVFLYMK